MRKQKRKPPALPGEVFLSHAHQDHKVVVRLAKELRLHGIKVWYSEHNIVGAQQWMDEIGVALKRCDSFVLLLTPDAVVSQWVKHEVTFALNHGRYKGRIIPLLLKDCEYEDLAWPLGNFQIITFKPFRQGLTALLKVWGLSVQK